MKLILLGAPGAGKGTQAERLSKVFDIPAISTGNILRAAMKARTPVGLEITEAMNAGQLVSDELVVKIVEERVAKEDCARGYILDGMPRTLAQARALEKSGFEFDAAILLQVSDEEILRRMEGRRVCPDCGATYNVEAIPPKVDSVCDVCGGEIIRRADDDPETVKSRLEIYHRETEPLIAFYAERGILKSVECTPYADQTLQIILHQLGEKK